MDIVEEIKRWFYAAFHPQEVIAKESGKTDWGTGFIRVILAQLLVGISAGFGGFLLLLTVNPGAGLIAWLFTAIFTPIMGVIGWLIQAVFLFITAKILGGKADFSKHTLDLTWVVAPIATLTAAVAWIPIAGKILGGLIGLYALYPLTIVLRETHEFSTGKAVLTWAIWAVILIIIALIFAVALFAMFASLGMSAMQSTPTY